jgi:PAS domain S-box-containing protein
LNTIKSTLFNLIKRKESPLFLILFIAGLSLIGWLTGKMGLASFSLYYIPIAHSSALVFVVLCILFFINIHFDKSRFTQTKTTPLIIFVILFCLFIVLKYFFNFSSDIEKIFIKNPAGFGNVPIGRMSPISALLFILICISLLSIENSSDLIKYIGGSFSFLVFLISSILIIGYLYKVPLLYGSKIIPVSLPTAICFLLFCITLLRIYELRFWTYNLIKDNTVTRQLLKSFLPIVVFMVIFQGYLIANFSFHLEKPTLSVALILLIIVPLTIILLVRVSANIGAQLLKTEQQLKESEEKFRSIMENSADAIFITNQQGEYVYTNKAVTVMLGYTSEEMKRKTIADISPPNKFEEYFEYFKQILNEGKGFTEIELLKKDGNLISTDLNTVLLPDGNVYGSCRDITERKHSDQALKESDTKYRMIADYNYDWEFWLTNGKRFKYNSPSCERISGYKAIDFFNNPDLFTQIIHPDDLSLYKNHLEPESEKKACNGIDYRIITRSGEVRWINHVCQPVYDESGVNIGRRGSNSDITRRKNDENVIFELNRKLRELNADKDRFISILGHDLKSPFNNILGLSEVLTEDIRKLNAEEIDDIANNIYKTARNTNNLLEDILMWARTQQGKIPFKPKKINFSEICRKMLEILNPGAYAKNITISYSVSDHTDVYADIDMLKTIMLNLVSNAIKFTYRGGAININAEENSGYVTISVLDNGIGIKSEDLTKLFDISEVITTKGTANESGTGLGLLLCKEFVEKHGGKIWVESKAGEGSDFKFSLPIFKGQTT